MGGSNYVGGCRNTTYIAPNETAFGFIQMEWS
jgi:hypothetical protein